MIVFAGRAGGAAQGMPGRQSGASSLRIRKPSNLGAIVTHTHTQVVLVLMTTAPSGPVNDPNGRDKMTSFETVRRTRRKLVHSWALLRTYLDTSIACMILGCGTYVGDEATKIPFD